METIIPIEDNDTLAALRGFLQKLLETGSVEAVFVPMEVEGGSVVPALVTDPARLAQADPLAPIMPINNARAVSALTGKGSPVKLAAVLRPCEIRALIELVKLQQASLDNLILIGLDCPGTFELPDFVQKRIAGSFDLVNYLQAARDGGEYVSDGLVLRPACQMCDQPLPEHADIQVHLFGDKTNDGLPMTVPEEIAERLGYHPEAGFGSNGHQTMVDTLVARRRQVRTRELTAMQERMTKEGMANIFATCIRCHNCMTVCPICYCKTCLFKTASFDHQPEHYYKMAHRKGAMRLLGDTLLFHMTRLNHMSLSCVSCGMCTSACPADIPVGAVFSAVGAQVQAAFDYLPGRRIDEPLPLITFQANEWTKVGE